MSRTRLILSSLAALGLALPLGAWALDAATLRFSATVAPTAVKPLSSHSYTIAILNRPQSDESAQSAQIKVPVGFIVDPSTLTAATTTAVGCSAATWTATLGADTIDLASPDAGSELDHGCTLKVAFSAVAPLTEDTYTWTTSVSRGGTPYDLQGAQPTVTVDGTPPSAPALGNPPANPSNDTSPTFAFSDGEAGVSFQCQLDGGGFLGCTSPKTYSGPLSDGSHTFDVKAVDPAGNESGVTSYTWTIDTLDPPAPTIDSKPANPSNDDPVSFGFSDSEGGAGFQCKLDGAAFAACTSPKTYSVSNGSHTFQVMAVDAAGNSSSAVSYTWTEDRTAPTLTLSTKPANPTNDQTPTFAFSANEAVTGVECSLDGAAFAACTSPVTYGLQAEGSHTFAVHATDLAGNTGSASYTWTIDITPPAMTLSSKPPNPSADTTPTFEFSANETVVNIQCKLDNGSFSSCSSPKTYSTLASGEHTFTVRGTDLAGNTGSSTPYTWTIDTTNPVVTITEASKPPNPTNLTSATFSFTSNKTPSTFQCQLDSGGFSPCTSPKSYGPGLGEGTHAFSVKATDSLNHTGLPSTYTWTIDLTPPAAPSIAGGPPAATNQTNASFVFSDEAGAAFECRLDAGGFSACTSPAGYSGLADGAHEFAVRATDPAGNTGAAATYGWTVDTVAPETTLTTTPDPVSSSASATFGFTSSEAGSSFACSIDGGAFASCSSPQTYGALANGPHTFRVLATDPAGNSDSTAASYSWQVATLTPPDTTPPGTVRRLRRSVGYRLLKLAWARPPDADFDHVRVLMSRGSKTIPRTVVYQGRALSYANKRFQNGTYFRYAVVSYDHFGNASRRVTVAVPPSVLLRSPADGAVVKAPPRLLWAPVPKATFYNVQLYSVTAKMLSAWPGAAKLTLSRRWTYAGRRFELKKGVYRWFVWPGFGPRAKARYGQLLGQGTFRVS